MLASRGNFQQFHAVFPGNLAEDGRRRHARHQGQGLAGDALGLHGAGLSRTPSVTTGAVAAEQEFGFVALEKTRGEVGIAGEGIAAGVRGEIAVDVGKVGQDPIRQAALFDGADG